VDEGLVLLAAWSELAVLVAALLYVLLRDRNHS
jgi:hypothetical protein